MRPLAGFDTWWHLAAGREIVRAGAVPKTDPFSFTRAGAEWIDHSWLWQTAAWGLVSASGIGEQDPAAGLPLSTGAREQALWMRDLREERAASALTFVTGLVLACGFVLGFEALRRRGAGLAAAFAVPLVAALGARVRYQVRPEAAAMTLFAAAFFLLESRRLREEDARDASDAAGNGGGAGERPRAPSGSGRLARIMPPVGLLVLAVIGANLHPSVVLLPFLALLHEAGAGWERAGGPAGALRALPAAACRAAVLGLATVANPAGWKLWLVPLRVGEVLQARASFVPEWRPPTPADTPVFFLVLAAVLALLVWAFGRAEGLSGLLPLAALGALACTGIRHTGLFLIVAPIAAAPALAGLLRSVLRPVPMTAAALAIGCPLAALALERPALPQGGVDRATTPVEACRFIALHEPHGALYNDLRFGGYLDWRFAPQRLVFVDGRMELFVPLLRELEGIYSGARPWSDWAALLERHHIEGALIRYADSLKGVVYPGSEGGAPRKGWRAYSAYLFPSDAWALVYWDDTAMLWLRRGGGNDDLIRRYAYEVVNPEDEAWQLEQAGRDPEFREALRRDLSRRSKEAPPSRRAADLLGRLGAGDSATGSGI